MADITSFYEQLYLLCMAERDTESAKVIRKLGGACLTLTAKLKLAEDRERGYLEALNNEKKKRKRGQPFTEELRAEEGVSVLFFSPSKVQKARELLDAKEAAKEREALEKVSRAEVGAALKAQKQLQAQQKREDRVKRAEARKAEVALKKAQREQTREARMAQKRLQTESKAIQKRPRVAPHPCQKFNCFTNNWSDLDGGQAMNDKAKQQTRKLFSEYVDRSDQQADDKADLPLPTSSRAYAAEDDDEDWSAAFRDQTVDNDAHLPIDPAA
ncbi:hypothetical protein B0A54_17677 [Friedmanniomyces endolithicus]|uniref:Uncharacterized protein n=1 Tax=Friedmanniomyces endolithicus TaxID=329885 RepID=A0A4U0TT94_9PEZI|nr:hypothetical protein B0A54_17677 [Friedmanniomyces endolithicus]